jgi:uncharacterized damage-inducible protein DinB
MALIEALRAEFEHEMPLTRTTLARTPANRAAWRPHPKSMSFGELAMHVADAPGWMATALNTTQFDFAPLGAPPHQPTPFTTTEAVLALFDQNVAKARAALAAAQDDQLSVPWSLLAGGKVLFTMPRLAVLRDFGFNHIVHHRAQLGLYLRLNDLPVPSVYGPTADEGSM